MRYRVIITSHGNAVIFPIFREKIIVKSVRFIILFAMLLMSHVVLAAIPLMGSTAESNYARQLAPLENKAIVYIYQQSNNHRVSPPIQINNYNIGRLVPGSFTVWKLSPGKLKIGVGGTNPSSVSIISKAGKVYLFRLSIAQTSNGPSAQFTGLPGSFRSDLNSMRLIKNPRTVTSLATRNQVKPAKPVNPPKQSAPAKPKPVPEPKPAPRFDLSSDSTSEPDVPMIPGGIGLLLKTGALSLSDTEQVILGTTRQYDESVSGFTAIEAYYQFDSGMAFGGEFISYSAAFTTAGVDKHEVGATILFANIKNYYRVNNSLQPFIGAGVGAAATDISGPTLSGNTTGIAYQLMAGIEYRSPSLGVFGEFKYIGADTESDNNESIDISGTGVLVGVAFHF